MKKVRINTKMLLMFAFFAAFMFHGCQEDSFSENLQVEVLPTNLSYASIINAREFGRIETGTPTIDSNGFPVSYEIVSVRKGDVVLDDTYLSHVSINNPETIEFDIPDSDTKRAVSDLSNAGKIIIDEGNNFANGDYYFTIKSTVSINGQSKSVTFDDALHIMVGPGLVEGLSFCPFKYNFVSGTTTTSLAPDIFGGNADVRFELANETDKLSIDSATGVISVNPSYTITAEEYIYPTIDVVSNISEEKVSFENTVTIALSTSAVTFDREVDYFFYPQLKPQFANNPAAGGTGYSIESSSFSSKPGWVKKNIYKQTPNNRKLAIQEAVDTRTAAGAVVNGLNINFWGPLANPWETWAIMDPVNLTKYKGCFESKLVFWVFQGHNTETLDYFSGDETPVRFEVNISNGYTGDVNNTSWTVINDMLKCKIQGVGDELTGTPYPLSGTLNANNDAIGKWVRCELDLSEYGDMSTFTLAFRSKTSYDTDLPFNLRGELFISDVHFVAAEKL